MPKQRTITLSINATNSVIKLASLAAVAALKEIQLILTEETIRTDTSMLSIDDINSILNTAICSIEGE